MTEPALFATTAALLQALHYTKDQGWLASHEFTSAKTHRFALEQASGLMHVVGAFCWMDSIDPHRVVPLSYVAQAPDRAAAKEVHRKVWSQGLVPFLLVATPDEVIVCNGFTFDRHDWERQVATYSSQLVQAEQWAQTGPSLKQLHSARLRSSLTWRDHALEVSGRVDRKLLDGLAGLSLYLTTGKSCSSALPYTVANALIGKMLYVFFLSDRGIIDGDWFELRGHKNAGQAGWSKRELVPILRDLDEVFNGSIFPISGSDWSLVNDSHVELVTRVLKQGAMPHPEGALQLSFLDVDLAVLRVETLSAIYEQFLANAGETERARSGAYYTPPFLVDLVLDRIEEWQKFDERMRVLDPACGSGVFLVGAYRRILESERTSAEPLPLNRVRHLLTSTVFGFERNLDACHVAAFSLYLTMLDYVTPRDLLTVARGLSQDKLFPPLVGKNIRPQDFFDPESQIQVTCVVGNPPWQSLAGLESQSAQDWANNNPDAPFGDNQVAELFAWKVLQQHLGDGGLMSLLLPAKTFVNPSSRPLRQRLAEEHSILGVINLAHMRYKLFGDARHACAALFVRRRTPTIASAAWFYSPLSISQPLNGKQFPWTLTFDRSELVNVRQLELASDARSWFELMMLRPVDRHIYGFVRDQIAAGKIRGLGDLCRSAGASLSRGGNSIDSGVSAVFIDEANSPWSSAVANKGSRDTRIQHELFADLLREAELPVSDRLPEEQLAKARGSYKLKFGGNIVLIPRNFREVRFVGYPKAFNSSFLAIYFDRASAQVRSAEKKLLHALARYLQSDVARYFLVTGARRWLMDRANVEPDDLKGLPVPFRQVDDPRIGQVLDAGDDKLDAVLMRLLGLPSRMRDAIYEFLEFRIKFKDGNVPADALDIPAPPIVRRYSRFLERSLDELMGREAAFAVHPHECSELGVAVVGARYMQAGESPLESRKLLANASARALDKYASSSSNAFAESLTLDLVAENLVFAVKPLERFRWTSESAYADSRRILAKLTASAQF